MQDHIDRIEEEKTFIEEIEVTIKSLIDTIEDKPVIKKKLEKTKNIRQELDTVLRGYLKDLNFYHDNDNCPTCKQGIDHNFKETIIDERNQKKREAEDGMDGIEIKITELEARIEEISKVEDVIQSHNLKIGEHRAQIKMSMNALKSFKNDLDAAEKEVEEVDTSKLEEFNKTLKDLQNDQVKLFDERETLGVAAAMLKDGGIKTRIIRKVPGRVLLCFLLRRREASYLVVYHVVMACCRKTAQLRLNKPIDTRRNVRRRDGWCWCREFDRHLAQSEQ